MWSELFLFLFQAEEGIGYSSVTGVQTCVFFFSSRRRHTRFKCDWSSDVCSSDLRIPSLGVLPIFTGLPHIPTGTGNTQPLSPLDSTPTPTSHHLLPLDRKSVV